MKTKIKIAGLMLLAGLGLTSCSSEEINVYGDSLNGNDNFSSFQWYTSGDRVSYRESVKEINIDTYLAFFDVSVGVKSRNWSIPASGKFLNKKFTETDSVFTPFIIPNSGTTSNEELINVLFTEAGEHQVKLSTSFKNEVTYRRIFERDGEEIDTLITSSVVDTIFRVKVFANPVPTGKVYKQNYITNPLDPTGPTILDEANPYSEIVYVQESDDPKESDKDSWLEISIEAGEKLQFEDLSTIGEVNARKWYFEGGKPATSGGEVVQIAYNKLTEGDTYYTAYFESKRTADVGPVKNTTKLIPLKIKVIPSTKPFKYNSGLKVIGSGIISFPVTGEVESFVGQEGNFTVNVKNSKSGFDQNIAVESVGVNKDDATIIELTLAEPVYNSDEFTISFTDNDLTDANGIFSVDGRSLESFDPVTTSIKLSEYEGVMNITDYTGYESVYNNSGNQYKLANFKQGLFFAQHNGNSEAGPLYYWRDDSNAYEGNSSLKFETPATGIPALARLQGGAFKSISPVPAGTYIPSVWVFVDPATTMSTIQYNFTDDTLFNFDISSIEKGKWVQVTLPEVDLPVINSGRLDINITNSGQDDAIVQKLWLDNFDLLVVNNRP